jgi:predicted acetyltransferase
VRNALAADTSVSPARAADDSVLRNLAQLYAYDFAEVMGWDIPDSGRFPDAILDGCFAGGARHPFLLRAGERLAGFAIVDTRSRLSGDQGVFDMAEFFVARTVRRRGVGSAAARTLFDRFGGRWEVRQTPANLPALAFWRRVIGDYTGGAFTESFLDTDVWRGPVQSFVCPG